MPLDRAVRSALIAVAMLACRQAASAQELPEVELSHWRQPVALFAVPGASQLITANRGSGTLSIVDLAGTAVRELSLGKQLSDLAGPSDGTWLVASDEAAGELMLLRRSGRDLQCLARTRVARFPVRLRLSPDGRRCYVASLWSRQLTVVAVNAAAAGAGHQTKPDGQALQVIKKLALPFAPREMLLVEGGWRLIVADAFGGKLAIIATDTLDVAALRDLPAHNIRGLAISPDGKKLLVAHQILNDLAETTHNDVHWGVLMSNVLRWLVLQNVLDPKAPILDQSHVQLTGDFNAAGGDPAGVAITPQGLAVVALSGFGQVGVGREADYNLRRLDVGRRPLAVALSPDARQAYVLESFDDSLAVIDLQRETVTRRFSLGPRPQPTLAQRGELLFYDARLSLDGWFSCHSCHTDGHTNGLLNDNLGDGSFGAAKRILSLLGVAETGPWAWNGTMERLDDQVRKSITRTMHGEPPSDADVAALVEYLKTLRPPPSLPAAREELLPLQSLARGAQLFAALQCDTCHAGPTLTSEETYDVGLVDKLGNRRFNPPSLRGVSQRGPYFHANQAATLEEVLTKFRHQLPRELNSGELADLLAYLNSL